MKKPIHLIIYSILLILLLTSPFWLWMLQPSKKLNMLIMDKTVPNQSYREHKGLVWVLNHMKFVKNSGQSYSASTDYQGFVPESGKKYSISPMPKNLKPYDVYYLTDQYGVYNQEFYGTNPTGKSSSKIYGGLEDKDVDRLQNALLQTKGKTLISEFNTFASPTSDSAKEKISNLLNLDWSGWTGRYFADLNSTEVPEWVKQEYQKQNQKWSFTGEGFVFVSKNNYIVVISGKDVQDDGLNFHLTANGKKQFGEDLKGTYQYWFDIVEPRASQEVLAQYELPVSKKAKNTLQSYGIPTEFPAVIYHQNAKYSSYYFAGDYADEAEVPGIYQTKGIDLWKKQFAAKESFYWKTYVPMMKDLLTTGLHKTDQQTSVGLVDVDGIKTNSKTDNSYIQVQKDGKWQDFLIKGVNMGIGKPGYFPGETAITKDEYLRWFKEIGSMNANAIRVYTLHPPQFYEAFYEYNQMADKPLYLFHGSWVNEDNLLKTQDAFADVNTEDAKTEIKNMIDIIHGNADLPARPGHASGQYKYDISKYVIGMIVGTEWDPSMVQHTNAMHPNLSQFNGRYFHTENASPFEVWLAGLLDYAADYETQEYKWQHTMSFTNWVTTDLLTHPAEPLATEDMVSVDPNHIKPSNAFHAGMFASYHVYPYYPDFLNYEQKYLNYVDADGNKNNYAGYLHDLLSAHHMPVLVAEFGVPSSRGLTHKNAYGMNQGFLSEKEQGQIDTKLFKSIVSEGYAGGLVFTWQDEWFKRTWNTMDVDDPNRRPYWDNEQTNEQHFGLLGFEPSNKDTKIVVDGDSSDWDISGVKNSYTSKNKNDDLQEMRVTSDSGYLYFLLKYKRPVDFSKQGTYLLLDTIGDQGQTKVPLSQNTSVKTDFGIDFLIKLTGPKSSRILVDSYYDSFYYQYAEMMNMLDKRSNANQKDNGVFNPIRLALNKSLTIPSTGKVIPFQDYETGVLKFGNANDDSLTDVSVSGDGRVMEGRIPWALLNFKDPSQDEVMGDLWKTGLGGSSIINGIRVAVAMTDNGKVTQTFPKQLKERSTYVYPLKKWDMPAFYEQLKKSYDIMGETYRKASLKEAKK
jgi:hypothetical protein